MNNLFHFFVITFSILMLSFLISCATLPEECIKYTAFETCRETYQGEVFCRNRKNKNKKVSIENQNVEVRVDKDQWEQEKPGRLSLLAEDVADIIMKLKLLETMTCDE